MKNYEVFSFGAGVQSTTLLMMACHGELKKPDYVVFADTGWEPKKIYNHLDFCIEYAKKFNIHIDVVKNGNIREDILNSENGKKRFASLPFFTLGTYEIKEKNENNIEFEFEELIETDNEKKYEVRKGMVRRQCTNEYKIIPIQKAIRKFAGLEYKERAKNILIKKWLGISTDEIQRVKPSLVKYIKHEYPLINLNMSRNDCLIWLEKKGFKNVPKSSCIGCPFHNDQFWVDMKYNDFDSWNDAVLIDREIRNLKKFQGNVFLHKSCIPLDQVQFKVDHYDYDLFNNECTGHCGV